MIRICRVAAGSLALSGLLVGLAAPASAERVGFRMDGDITGSPDFSACVSVEFDDLQTILGGQFSAVGGVWDSANTTGVQYVHRIGNIPPGGWSTTGVGPYCTPVFAPGPVYGEQWGAVLYTFNLHTVEGDIVISKVCRDAGGVPFECGP